jgi:elongation factor Ts
MGITASQVSELRAQTGVGLMECKKALVDSNGNIENAIKALREKGLAKAQKKAERSTSEGKVFVAESSNKNSAALIQLNCETDFVAGNAQFSELGNTLAQLVLNNAINSVEQLNETTINGRKVSEFISEYIVKLGENLGVATVASFSNAACVSSYVHMNGKIGVLVAFNGVVDSEISRSIAMQIAAVSPTYIRPEEVNTSELDAERDIIKKQALQEGKPEAIVDKIVEGRLQKYYKEVCLLEQPFIKEDKKAVKEILPTNVTVEKFVRIAFG